VPLCPTTDRGQKADRHSYKFSTPHLPPPTSFLLLFFIFPLLSPVLPPPPLSDLVDSKGQRFLLSLSHRPPSPDQTHFISAPPRIQDGAIVRVGFPVSFGSPPSLDGIFVPSDWALTTCS